MGLKNKFGLRYLVFRTDNGQPTYFRRFSDRIRPFLKGQVLGPGGGTYNIKNDQPAVRIAFPKGSDAQISSDWAHVHTQVEVIVASAIAAQRALLKAVTAVNAITSTQHHQMLDQVRHGILAADDRIRKRPNEVGEIGKNMGKLWEKSDQRTKTGAAPATARELQQRTQDVLRRMAEHAKSKDDPPSFDVSFEEGEPNVEPDTLDMLLRLSSIAEPKGLRLDPRMTAEINLNPVEMNTVASEVETLLVGNGISLPIGHEDRLQLALDIPRAQSEAYADMMARRNGSSKLTPPQPPAIELPTPAAPTLSAMRLKWLEQATPGEKARDDNKLYVDAFVGQFGDLPIDQITKSQIREFRDLLAKRPRNLPRDLRGERLSVQVAWAMTQGDCLQLTPNTVNAKGIGSLSVIMEIAMAEDVIAVNPCAKLLLKIKGKACERLPYSAEDINRLGASPLYAEGRRWKAGAEEAAFWMPLIGLFAGARLEEIGQLLVADICRQGSINYFNLFDLDDEDGAAGLEGKKSLKTPAARRKVPIHPFLIELGFLCYVEWLRTQRMTQLFPNLSLYRGRRTKEFSKW